MRLKFASLGSGSAGNGTVVSNGDTHLLVDCGFSMREAQRRLSRLSLSLEALSAILVTHEHADHLKGVAAIARKHHLPVYMTPGTYYSREQGTIPKLELIHGHAPFTIESIDVMPVPVPHDAREPTQFVFSFRESKLGLLTDLGSVTSHVVDAYSGCDALLVEANHDPSMLAAGPYPPSLKARVGGPWGHLSNAQAANLLDQMDLSNLQHLVVGHISRQNNSLDRARATLNPVVNHLRSVHYACQDEGFDWLIVN